MRPSAKIGGVAIAILLGINCLLWSAAGSADRSDLRVSFLDVGQGDAILIEAPSGNRMLIDGGPDQSVLRALSERLPWFDRSIDVVIATHPDADHITGLVDVLERYRVSYVFTSSVEGTTDEWRALEREIDERKSAGLQHMTASRGQVIDLGGAPQRGAPHAYLEILFPDRDVSAVDTNVGCVVARLQYGNTSFMLPCDSPQNVERYLVGLDGAQLHSTVLKAGHHGSKTSSSDLFVGFVDPEYAVYSRGCDNKYGFPSPETVATFARFGIPTSDTCTSGTVTFTSDGDSVVPL